MITKLYCEVDDFMKEFHYNFFERDLLWNI